jgi:hypothetical protein
MPASPTARSPAPGRAGERDDAYASLEPPDALPVASLMLFALALAARPVVRLLPREWRPYPWGVLAPVALALVASLGGVLLAAWSLRRTPGRGVAQIALLLNGVVVTLTALAAAFMARILTR